MESGKIDFEEGSDDDIFDHTFLPEKLSRKRSLVEENSIEPTIPKKKAEFSQKLIFREEFYVDITQAVNNGKITVTANCATSHRSIRGCGEVTSNFITHLRLRHNAVYMKFVDSKNGPNGSESDQAVFDKKIIRCIVDAALPVSIVDRKSLVDLRQTGMKRLHEGYNNMIATIRSDIASAKYFCTTADIWSGNQRSFFGYTCHWLSDKFERRSAALACKRLKGAHTSEKISQMIAEINSFFGLSRTNVVTTVTDNGSNFVKAFKEHGALQSSEEYEDDSDYEVPIFENEYLPSHHRCASHTLNLIASADFIKILKLHPSLYTQQKKTFEKCNLLWKKCKCPKSAEIIVSILGACLVVPVVTRWNSLYDAVLRLLRHKNILDELCDKLTLQAFSTADIQFLVSYLLLMSPIAQALDFLQGEKHIHYGCLIPTLVSLSNKLNKLSKKTDFYMGFIAVQLDDKLRERFGIFFNLAPEANTAIVAAVLNPEVKLKFLKILQKKSPVVSEEHIITRVIDSICAAITSGSLDFKINIKTRSTVPENSLFYDFNDDDDENDQDAGAPTKNPTGNQLKALVTTQVYVYLNDPADAEVWLKYSCLKEAFIYFNTSLTSSAPVERLFSFAGIVNSPRRKSLGDFTFEKLVLMKSNGQ